MEKTLRWANSVFPNVHLERNFVRELYAGERLVKKIRDDVEHLFIIYCVKVWIRLLTSCFFFYKFVVFSFDCLETLVPGHA